MRDAKIALANPSSLKQDKSSKDPPPLPIIIKSTKSSLFALFSALIKLAGASCPCTKAGYK